MTRHIIYVISVFLPTSENTRI